MNNVGQVTIFLLMLGLVIIIVALAIAPAITEFTDDARNQSSLDFCNSSADIYDKAVCVSTDITTPYFVWFLIGLAGVLIGAKILLGE